MFLRKLRVHKDGRSKWLLVVFWSRQCFRRWSAATHALLSRGLNVSAHARWQDHRGVQDRARAPTKLFPSEVERDDPTHSPRVLVNKVRVERTRASGGLLSGTWSYGSGLGLRLFFAHKSRRVRCCMWLGASSRGISDQPLCSPGSELPWSNTGIRPAPGESVPIGKGKINRQQRLYRCLGPACCPLKTKIEQHRSNAIGFFQADFACCSMTDQHVVKG